MNVKRTFADGAISVDPNVMSGAPVFAGTRVLVESLFHYISAGEGVEDFLQGFPSVTREQALKVLEAAGV
jgi:uncharacterized protein (DUF433 family)